MSACRQQKVVSIRPDDGTLFSTSFIDGVVEKVVTMLLDRMPGPKIAPRYLSYEQAGEYMGVSSEAVRSYVRLSYFPATMKGGKRWLDKEDIDRFMKNNKKFVA